MWKQFRLQILLSGAVQYADNPELRVKIRTFLRANPVYETAIIKMCAVVFSVNMQLRHFLPCTTVRLAVED